MDDLTGRKATVLEDGVPGLSLSDKASSAGPFEVRRFERSIEAVLRNRVGDGVEVALLDGGRATGSSCVRAERSIRTETSKSLRRQWMDCNRRQKVTPRPSRGLSTGDTGLPAPNTRGSRETRQEQRRPTAGRAFAYPPYRPVFLYRRSEAILPTVVLGAALPVSTYLQGEDECCCLSRMPCSACRTHSHDPQPDMTRIVRGE